MAVLERCHTRIRNVATQGGMLCFYEVPGLVVGMPLYNLEECIEYAVNFLRKDGFLVQILPPPHVGVLYISWNPDDLRPKRPALRHTPSSTGGAMDGRSKSVSFNTNLPIANRFLGR